MIEVREYLKNGDIDDHFRHVQTAGFDYKIESQFDNLKSPSSIRSKNIRECNPKGKPL